MPCAEGKKVIQILKQNWSPAVTRGHTMAMVWPSAYSVALRLQRVPRALQGRVRVSRALHGREGRLTRLAPAPRALGGRRSSQAASDSFLYKRPRKKRAPAAAGGMAHLSGRKGPRADITSRHTPQSDV